MTEPCLNELEPLTRNVAVLLGGIVSGTLLHRRL